MLLILLKDEYLGTVEAQGDDPAFRDFVCQLGQTLHDGRHAVKAPPLLLERLAAWSGISEPQAQALAAASRDAVRPSLPYALATDALVLTGPDGVTADDTSSDTVLHRMHWRAFTDHQGLRPTTLLGEHRGDARWFALLAEAYSARIMPLSSRPGAEVRLDCHLGGGNTTAVSLEAHVAGGAPTLCIVDSDRDHPDAQLGQTGKRVRKTIDRFTASDRAPPARMQALAARDVENILPVALLEAVCSDSAWFEPMVAAGFFVAADRPLDPRLAWIDIGKDQCSARLLSTKDPKTLELRRAVIAQIRESLPETEPCPLEESTPACSASNGARWGQTPDGCKLIHSVGKPLPKLLTYLTTRSGGAGMPSATWLCHQLPDSEPAVWQPARLAWSWGMRQVRAVR